MIGRALIDHLTARGDEVVGVVRRQSSALTVPTIEWDPARRRIDRDALASMGPIRAIINLAGAGIGDHRWSSDWRREIIESRVNATQLSATLAAERQIPLISASAIGYYGDRGDEMLDENAPAGTGYLAEVCQAWENASHDAPHRTTVRFGIVLSRRGGAFRRQLPLFQSGVAGRLGSGQQYVSVVSLTDVCRALMHVLDQQLEGTVNVVSPTAPTNSEFTRELAHQLHRPAAIPVPKWALRQVLGADRANELLLASQRVVPRVLLDSGFSFEHLTLMSVITAALADRN